MSYQSTITRKGQITIPKEIRKIFKLEEGKRVDIEYEIKNKEIKIKHAPDILDLAGTFKPEKVINAVKVRELMTRKYKPR